MVPGTLSESNKKILMEEEGATLFRDAESKRK